MSGPQIQNPTGAFGAPVLSGFDASKPGASTILRAAVTTITAGDLVAYSSSAGYVIRALTGTAVNLLCGVAMETVTSAGNAINIAIGGWVVANKGTAAITAGNYVTVDTTTTGAIAAVTDGKAVTLVSHIQGFVGVCMVNATAGDTTCNIWIGGTVS